MSNNYTGLRTLAKTDPDAAKRCAARVRQIRQTLLPLRKRKSESSLLLATWNIRDFDSNKFGFGPRLAESFYYIAEMISCFDLVAVQEVNRDLAALDRLMRILGREWDYIATDTTTGAGGNDERMAFVFNTEKVWFRKIAGEIVLPEGQLIVSRKKAKAAKTATAAASPSLAAADEAKDAFIEVKQQFARTPFLVAFQSGWFRFSLCTVHIYFGADSGEALKRRIAEIEQLVGFFAERQDKASKQEKDRLGQVENYILLGDFNVVSPEHKTMAALKSKGFTVPAAIDGKKVRGPESHYYDQIAVRVKDPRFKVVGGGLIDMFQDVFRNTAEDRAIYASVLPKSDPETDPAFKATTPEKLFEKWRTWQMSDHAPLWIEIETDFADDYLDAIVKG
ncbi:endonuclease/exonuclease/phosphatase family protein [Bosea sp. (in: a-proteobacteria)]|uniref:endonuclease/exonuclease/phosphatase family protein n=1 Tax=Bosea sp. (in: a-proteobacteria) TaxID=1871050 RepID=UPI000A426CA8|nr:endonuclease/exonuclease/phosphatase family protein [Bosea sp. (in: a-proteobacteria)]